MTPSRRAPEPTSPPAPLGTATGLVAYRARVTATKQAAILDAAIATFLDVGYERTTLEQIAGRASVSTGTLFKHFPTKAALFGAIMARAWAADSAEEVTLPKSGDPRAGLTAIGRDYAAVLRDPSTVPLFRVVIAEAPRFPELGEQLYARGKAPYLDRLARYLRAERAVGTLQVPDDAIARAVHEFLGMINDQLFWPRLLVVRLEVTHSEVEAVIASAVETMLARYGTTNDLRLDPSPRPATSGRRRR